MRSLRVHSAIAVILATSACSKPEPGPEPMAPTSASPDPAKDPTASATAKPGAVAAGTNTAAVGQPSPDFELTGLDGAKAKLSDHRGKIVVLEWFNPDCPYVKNAHSIGSLKGLAKKMKETYGDDLVWLAVNSGAEGKQGHGDDTNRAGKEKYGIDYPILYDADGKVGKAYGATNTPHMYVIDKTGTLVYAGALDNTGSGDPEDAEPELINYVDKALGDLKAGRAVSQAETKAWGCGVKYAKH